MNKIKVNNNLFVYIREENSKTYYDIEIPYRYWEKGIESLGTLFERLTVFSSKDEAQDTINYIYAFMD